jgi:hypothetical protein
VRQQLASLRARAPLAVLPPHLAAALLPLAVVPLYLARMERGAYGSLFVNYWLTLIPSLPESAQAAAQAKGRERFEAFIDILGRRLASGKSVLREISIDVQAERAEKATSHSAE